MTTTASTTTGAPATASGPLFIKDVQGLVMGDDVDGVLVHINVPTMQQIGLTTGVVDLIDLEHAVCADGPEGGVVVNGNLVS